ncbi:MAG: hypothetical protein HFE46_04395 [Clostridia bacterium]|nr:hypothetical protein [Clostridia bacterium]
MTKFRTSILICGCIVLCVIGALVAFLTLSASGMIVSDPIEISVRVDDNRKEYDGTPLSAESYRVTSGELLKGHELQITFVGSQTAVGASAGTADIKVTDAKKRDVSKQYVFTVTPCLLEVTQRTVSFVQENVTREYTGGGVAGGNYFLEKGTLCAGHHVLRSGIDVVAEVGRDVEDPAEPRIYDALGADVTANYAVHCTRGLISVQRRALTIAPIGATKTYDGTPLSPEGYRVVSGSLVDGHRLEVTYTAENGVASVVDAEEIAVRIAEATVWDADGKDVTNNYSIDKDATAVLKIEPCPITVTGKSAAFTYNGMAHAIADDHEPQSYAGDLAGAQLQVDYTAQPIANVGETDNAFTVTILRDGEPVTQNYAVQKITGKLSVTPLPVKLTLKSGTAPYTGLVHPLHVNTLVGVGGITEKLQEELTASISLQADREVKNAGVYRYTVQWQGAQNFAPALQDDTGAAVTGGVYTVTRAAVDIRYNGEIAKVYDGKPLRLGADFFCNQFAVEGAGLDGLYMQSATAVSAGANANAYDMDLSQVAIANAAGENITANLAFDIVTVRGVIKQRKITVEAGDIYWILQEGNLKEQLGLSVGSSLAEGEEIDWSGVVLRVNGNKLEFAEKDIRIYNAYNDTIATTDNYEIVYKDGTYTFVGEN